MTKKTPAELDREIAVAIKAVTIQGYQGRVSVDDATPAELREEMTRRVIEFRSSAQDLARRMVAAREVRELAEARPYLWDRVPDRIRQEVLEIGHQVKRAGQVMAQTPGSRTKVVVDTGPYRRNHGAEPRGRGRWRFLIGKSSYDRVDDPALYSPGATDLPYPKAREYATREAVRRGETTVYVVD